jgi:8-oxo-dGTP pyrophosphatase MutT (NUDIX family)
MTNQKIQLISCGGLVIDFENKKLLTIKVSYHQGKIEFPKGKMDQGETELQAATREIIEETGYLDLEPLGFLGKTNFSYVDKVGETSGSAVLKTVTYFLFRLKSSKQIKDKQESHERIQNLWLDLATAKEQLSFKNDKIVFEKALKILKKDFNLHL